MANEVHPANEHRRDSYVIFSDYPAADATFSMDKVITAPAMRVSRFLLSFILSLPVMLPAQADRQAEPLRLPTLTQTSPDAWINSRPLTREDLRGRVTLIDFWTYGCGNCVRSLPWLASLQRRYAGKDLQIIGIHTPEFAWEESRTAVAAAVNRHGIEYPVMLDNDMRFWRALGNRYWPAFYLVDKQGQVAGYYIGETHIGSRQAEDIESQLNALLK